jgi:hypothetical protein
VKKYVEGKPFGRTITIWNNHWLIFCEDSSSWADTEMSKQDANHKQACRLKGASSSKEKRRGSNFVALMLANGRLKECV